MIQELVHDPFFLSGKSAPAAKEDLPIAQELVETYGIKVEPQLHEEVRARYQALNLAPYKGFINPVYTPVTNAQGELTDITVSYT